MKLIDVTRQFKTDDDCLDYIESMRWPNGEIGCVHCGEVGRISKITREAQGKNKRTRIYQCLACGKQFSTTNPQGSLQNRPYGVTSKAANGRFPELRCCTLPSAFRASLISEISRWRPISCSKLEKISFR